MAQKKNRLGARVVGEDEAARQADEDAKSVGAQHTLGPRVTGILNAVPSTLRQASSATKLGVRVTDGEPQHKHDLSVEELENVLEENPTFFDSLYMGELHRDGGPRVAALKVFALVEEGIKGAGRKFIIDEINSLLGIAGAPGTPQDAAWVAREIAAKRQAYEEQQERQEANVKNVATANAPLSIEGRVQEIMHGAKPHPKAVAVDDGEEGRGPHADLDEDDVKPESQSKHPRNSQKKAKAHH